ncbi:MAG: phospholipase D family protein [Firmicutes bacterium]|nr:phospholipase D family protein [Bacillota bacterium]
MLNPHDRQLYLEALRPPAGYCFDRGVATTFSLDLTTLLIAPLSLAMFECESEKDFLADPIKVMEALRRSAEKLTVFCQLGRISIPTVDSLLYGYLEKMVTEVRPPNENGVFHPKVWVLRFLQNQKPFYRLLCLSRNITFDRSWDTLLVLEGGMTDREYVGNKPLADFIRHLPRMAVGGVASQCKKDIDLLSSEVMKVSFSAPEGFDDNLKFLPIGIPGYPQLPTDDYHERLLIVSPFLSEEILSRFKGKVEKILVSREDSLDGINPDTLESYKEIFIIDELAEISDYSEDEDYPEGFAEEQKMNGLHAKLFIAEHGKTVRVWTGSANATNAAFNGINVEFLVELSGSKNKVGIDRFLGTDEKTGSFRDLLKVYRPPCGPPNEQTIGKALEETLEKVRANLVSGLSLKAAPNESGFDLELSAINGLKSISCEGLKGLCWPISIKHSQAQSLDPLFTGKHVLFKALSPVGVTSFIAFNLFIEAGGVERTLSFVLNLPLEGRPAERDNLILQSVIKDRSSFIRYILFLLADSDTSYELSELIGSGNNGKNGNGKSSFNRFPLLEELLKALSRNPEKIDSIAKLVDDLMKYPEGEKLLPEGFNAIWKPICNARRDSIASR